MKIITIAILVLLSVGISFKSDGQTRQPKHTSIELGYGRNLYSKMIVDGDFEKLLAESEIFNFGIHRVTKYKNIHRINFLHITEKNISPVTNIRVGYTFEKTLSRGPYGRGFLGLLFGIGGGYESFDTSKYDKKNSFYPYGNLGLSYEFFLTRKLSLTIRDEGVFSFSKVTNNVQNNLIVGVKYKFRKSKSI